MTLEQALDNIEFNTTLNLQNFPKAFSYLDEAEEREKLFLLLQEENLNPLTGFTKIPEQFLKKCSKITKIEIPDTITSIGDYAFYHCYSLESIEIPDSVTSIGNRAFVRCDSLTSIEIPDSVASIDDSAFSGCDNLTEIVIPDSVTSIGFRAFENCERLTSVIIPDSVVWIGGCVFSYCYKLKEIQYKGTKKDALTRLKVRNKRWRAISFIERVICTDGVIDLT